MRGGIRLGAAAAVAALIALAIPGSATSQFGNIVVDTTADGNDGECANDCTLREAIAVADPNAGQWVSVPPGVYRVTLGPLVPQNDIVFGVSFVGNFSAGGRTTVIDARGSGRVIEVPTGTSAIFAGLTITGGSAPTGAAALVPSGAQLTVYDSIVEGNVASQRGGAIANAGNISVFNSTLTGNRVTGGSGGAIAGDADSNAAVYFSTLSGNTASGSGGAITSAGTLQIQQSTIAGNTAGAGGGLFQETGVGATAMWSTILAGNTGGDCGGAIAGSRSITSSNLAGDSTCQFASASEGTVGNPLLGPLRNNGGPTDTRAIGAGSPAIGAADPSFCSTGAADQRHAPVVGPCDIGAFEFGATPPAPVLPPPVAGETVNVNRSRGIVKIKIPGSDEFFDLQQAQQVPIGSTFDTSKGRVNLVAAGSAKAWFYEGVFKLRQGKGAKPLSTLALTGKLNCGGGKANAAAKKKKRRLWGDGKGKFRTQGSFSSATVRGTRWLVEDSCNGTLTRVAKGKVAVRYRGRTIVLRAGQKFFAKRR